jgi:NAD(P)-dependent dehydrogenase (short-subunit alcohol dehydrogenase family)
MKTAIVTGAGQGIGRAIALRLARDGFAVALADINPAALSAVRGEIESASGKAIGVEVDLSQVAEIQRLAKQTVAELGQLDALVNNAGRQITKPFLDVTEADWDALLELNLKTVFFAMQAAARHMIGSGTKGRLVSISSIWLVMRLFSSSEVSAGVIVDMTQEPSSNFGMKSFPTAIRPNAVGISKPKAIPITTQR